MKPAVQTFALTKYFPQPAGWRGLFSAAPQDRPALDRLSLEVRSGELFGLVGPNGAGKTTLIKILATLIAPTAGHAVVNGHPLEAQQAIKASIGLVTSDERSFYWRLSGRQNLAFFATLHGLPAADTPGRVEAVLGTMELLDVADDRFLTYSSGMRQRLSIARALLNQPGLLFLDEPTQGLDPLATRHLHDLIRGLSRDQGLTVLLTTHELAEAESLCQRVAILHHGRLQACGTLPELRASLGLKPTYRLLVSHAPASLQEAIRTLVGPVQIHADTGQEVELAFEAPDDPATIHQVLDLVRATDVQLMALNHQPASLEQVFTRLVQGPQAGPSAGVQPPSVGPAAEATRGANTTRAIRAGTGVGAPQTSPPGKGLERAMGKGARLGPGHSLRVALAFLRRDLQSEASYRFSFLLQFLGVFFSVGVFYFVAQLLGNAGAAVLEPYGGDYFAFVLIGIAFAGYFNVGLSGFASSLRRDQTSGTLEAMLSTPTGASTLILSSSLWSYALTTLRVLVYLGVGALFLGVDLGSGNVPGALLTLLLTVVAFSSLGIIAASFIMVLKRGDPITWVVGALSSLLGGVYYPIEVLPAWLQDLARLVPVTYALRAMRLALLQGAPARALAPDLLVLAAFCTVLLPLSLLAFRYAVQRARVDGSLTHY